MSTLISVLFKGCISMGREMRKLKALVLFSCSVIKVWDLRRNYAAFRQDPLPVRSFCYPGTSTRRLGEHCTCYSAERIQQVLSVTFLIFIANCGSDWQTLQGILIANIKFSS